MNQFVVILILYRPPRPIYLVGVDLLCTWVSRDTIHGWETKTTKEPVLAASLFSAKPSLACDCNSNFSGESCEKWCAVCQRSYNLYTWLVHQELIITSSKSRARQTRTRLHFVMKRQARLVITETRMHGILFLIRRPRSIRSQIDADHLDLDIYRERASSATCVPKDSRYKSMTNPPKLLLPAEPSRAQHLLAAHMHRRCA